MTKICNEILKTLAGKTLVTAESCTGGMIGGALTAVSGSSQVYKGGIISYTNAVKETVLGVPNEILEEHGPVSSPVAKAMAVGAKKVLDADIAVSVTGLAGPGGDGYDNPVGTVYIGYADENNCLARCYHFSGDRKAVRDQACYQALQIILEINQRRDN